MRSVTVLSRRWFHLTLQRTKFLQMGVARKIFLPYNTRTCFRLLSGKSCAIFSKSPLLYNGHFSAVFLSIGEEKMSPLSKKRGHHDLRILRFERIASTAAVRTHGDFGNIPSPLHLAYSPMLRSYPIMNHSVPSTCFLHELQIKTVQHSTDGYAEQHP